MRGPGGSESASPGGRPAGRRHECPPQGSTAAWTPFHIQEAAPRDRRWMLDRLVETAFLTLGPDRAQGLRPDAVRRRVAQEMRGIEGPAGLPNQAFVAWDPQKWRSGYVWVAEILEEFTGRRQGFVLELYVSPRHRQKGLGRLLLAEAERWTRARGLRRISLSVAEHNQPARALYESLGYSVETRRMGKTLPSSTASRSRRRV